MYDLWCCYTDCAKNHREPQKLQPESQRRRADEKLGYDSTWLLYCVHNSITVTGGPGPIETFEGPAQKVLVSMPDGARAKRGANGTHVFPQIRPRPGDVVPCYRVTVLPCIPKGQAWGHVNLANIHGIRILDERADAS